jgi:hypothetical protein
MISLFKRGMGMVFLMTVTVTHAQITTADNGLTATGTAPNKNVGLGGTLNNSQTAIDFNSSNSSSSLLLKKGTASYFTVNNDGTAKFFKSITLGDVSSNAPNDHVINYFGNQYAGRGLKLVNHYNGSIVRMHSLSDGLYVTKDDGSPAPIISENFSNPSDGSSLRATAGRWEISAGVFAVNQWWTGNAQYEMTIGSASRKGMIIKSAASQTGNLMEWKDNNNNILSFMNASGGMGIGTNGLAAKLTVGSASNNDGLWISGPGTTNVALLNNTTLGSWNALSQVGDNLLLWKGSAPDNSDAGGLVLGSWSNTASGIRIAPNGKVGVGVAAPAERLTVAGSDGNIYIGSTIFGTGYNGIFLNGSINPLDYNFLSKATDNNLYINRPLGAAIIFRQYNTTQMSIDNGGNVSIGTIAPGPYKLAVDGTIGARKIKVTKATPWADFVFENDYQLPTLTEVEQFIQQNKHLPGVPSAKEVQETGLDLGGNQAILLQKIEELTLYMIEQSKRLSAQQLEIENLKNELKTMRK